MNAQGFQAGMLWCQTSLRREESQSFENALLMKITGVLLSQRIKQFQI